LIGRILRRNRIVKRVVEGKREGRINVMGRRGRISKQLPGNPKDTKTCWKLKEEALECSGITGYVINEWGGTRGK